MSYGYFDFASDSPTGRSAMSGLPCATEVGPGLLSPDIQTALRSYVDHCRSMKLPISGGRVFVRFERTGRTRKRGPETVETVARGRAVALLPEGEYRSYEEARAALRELLPG